jgi:hypothetical protein
MLAGIEVFSVKKLLNVLYLWTVVILAFFISLLLANFLWKTLPNVSMQSMFFLFLKVYSSM